METLNRTALYKLQVKMRLTEQANTRTLLKNY